MRQRGPIMSARKCRAAVRPNRIALGSRTRRPGLHPGFDQRAGLLLRARHGCTAEAGLPGPADEGVLAGMVDQVFHLAPAIARGSLICVQISPTVFPSQAISRGAAADPDVQKAVAFAKETRCFIRYQRSFFRPLFPQTV